MLYKNIIASFTTLIIFLSFTPISRAAVSLPTDVSIAAGKYHSMVALDNGSLFAWGDNTKGQIGNGTTDQQNAPVKIMDNVFKVAAGDYTSYALTYSGDLYAWGDNAVGECGTAGGSSITKPIVIMHDVVSIAATQQHAYAITSDGALYFWGSSTSSGIFTLVGKFKYTFRQPGGVYSTSTPVKILDGIGEVFCNDTDTSIVKADGSFWCWSIYLDGSYTLDDTHTQVDTSGDNVTYKTWTLFPLRIADSVRTIASGGANYYIDGQGGLCKWGNTYSITLPDGLKNNIQDISGNWSTLFTTSTGDLYDYGQAYFGLDGVGRSGYANSAFTIIARDVKKVCVGEYHAILVKKNNEIWTWGTNEYGQLGNGTGVNYNVPCKIMDGNGTENQGGLNNPLSIVFDGKKVNFDVDPVTSNGRILVPFRILFETLDADVVWDGQTNTATATKDGTTITVTLGSTTAIVDGKPYKLDAAPEVISGRTMVPLRFITESMGCQVQYIASDKLIDIRSKNAYNLYSDDVKKKLTGYNCYIECGQNGASGYYYASGVVIDPSGIILTNWHVTAGMDWIRTTVSGVTYSNFKRIYEDSVNDYAIYKITGLTMPLGVPQFGKSAKLTIDSEFFTCGNPGRVRDQCYRGTKYYDSMAPYFVTTLYSDHGSSGSGVYNNALELVGIIFGMDSAANTLVVPIDLMHDQIDKAIAQYGSGAGQNAA